MGLLACSVVYVHGGWDNETHAPTHHNAGTEHPMPKYHGAQCRLLTSGMHMGMHG